MNMFDGLKNTISRLWYKPKIEVTTSVAGSQPYSEGRIAARSQLKFHDNPYSDSSSKVLNFMFWSAGWCYETKKMNDENPPTT